MPFNMPVSTLLPLLPPLTRSLLPMLIGEAGRVAAVLWLFPCAADSVRAWVLLLMALRGL